MAITTISNRLHQHPGYMRNYWPPLVVLETLQMYDECRLELLTKIRYETPKGELRNTPAFRTYEEADSHMKAIAALES